MTHDEIVAKMDDFNVGLSNGFGDVKTLVDFVNALRSVVELHTPDDDNGKTCEAHEQCWGCGEWGSDDECECRAYPCETIKAIVEALR
jgi:hypothetical protein